ncbi:16S rRNA (uracil(1498)-N(3))-methyltransferase [Helicobacter sp. 11S03491-1]|uniref:16S rRNA (uracil(1498)-N(3))-methyltransferase n=1 Tax=Helicobacter sp. 11S03491-1 TaxID=1476196 RepID=UPI000BA6F220|nr:16S rRNA (uracil(1498)-N(3))-methyltransferase [Helicobacter sp. 11S03491-1]PAF43061.1 16S rRNA (uracil(1498)-N(3))-methyltransferase [Helicobacter sp. 11S03491-1]
MQFVYHADAGVKILKIQGDLYTHIYQSRRTKFEKNLYLRNLKDDKIYTYEHIFISRSKSELQLCQQSLNPVIPKRHIHLIWAIIDNKNIEKTLPYLNQIGVEKITFFYANRSQKNEKISPDRLNKILIHSCEQCGRSTLMELEILSNTKEALRLYPKSCIFDFEGKDIYASIPCFENGVFIGPEGGFDEVEKKLFKDHICYATQQVFTLKSECAALFLASIAP